jgi:hypothetical protein
MLIKAALPVAVEPVAAVPAALVSTFVAGGSLATGGVVVSALGCGASVVVVVFGLEMGVAEAVAGGAFSFWSPLDFLDLPEAFLPVSFLLEDASPVFRGAMLFPFSVPEGELEACGGCAANAGRA